MTELRTDRLLLRPWRAQDREPFAAMNADPEVMEHYPAPLTRAQSDALVGRIEAHFAAHGYGLWVVDDGRFCGYTGLSWAGFAAPFNPSLEVGWRLARHAWGKGYATEAGRAALHRGLTEVERVTSFTALRNSRSIRVMEAIGMRRDREFAHPLLPEGHHLRPHVLYVADRQTCSPHSVLA